jgi:hypothetical protein
LRKLPSSCGRFLIWLASKHNLHSVPSRCSVIRLGRLPKDFQEKKQILAIQLSEFFNLSSADEKSIPPHLSVWVEALTSPKQAQSFLPSTNSPYKLVLRLKVIEIRQTIGSANESTQYPNLLNVIWVNLIQEVDGQKIRDVRPGASGHSGITGLGEGSVPNELTNRQKKNLRKDLRLKLAEIASNNNFLISD